MHRQSETRAGNHQRHTRTRNASLPTQANHTVRGARKQPPNQGAIHAALPLFRLLVTQRCQSRYNRQGRKAKDRCQSNASKATEQNTDHVERYQGRQCAIVQDTYTYLGPIIAPPRSRGLPLAATTSKRRPIHFRTLHTVKKMLHAT